MDETVEIQFYLFLLFIYQIKGYSVSYPSKKLTFISKYIIIHLAHVVLVREK